MDHKPIEELMLTLPPDYYPEPNERRYYRHKENGDRGFLIQVSGKMMIERDPETKDRVFMQLGKWDVEQDLRHMSRHQIAKVAFEADKELCRALGLHKEANREWLNLKDAERIGWTNKGPSGPVRKDLYDTIVKLLEGYVRD